MSSDLESSDRVNLKFFDRTEVYDIHQTTVDVLESTGVAVRAAEGLTVLDKAGADVDYKSKTARLPRYLVEEALKKASKGFTLYGRTRKHRVRLEGGRVYFTPSGQGMYVNDLETGQFRQSTLQDIEHFVRLTDALENMHIPSRMVCALDVQENIRHIAETAAELRNTEKPVLWGEVGRQNVLDGLEVIKAVAGGDEEFRRRPLVAYSACPVSPLQHDTGNTEGLIECAKMGIPCNILSMPMAGATGPVTLAGNLVVANAEILSGITLLEMIHPRLPILYGGIPVTLDQRTGIPLHGAPENALMSAGTAALGQFYGLPSLARGLSTVAKIPGDQACLEKTLTTLMPLLAGVNVIFGAGLLEYANTFDFVQTVIDDEIASSLLRMVRRIRVDKETLAESVIEEVGIGGSYLGKKHTREFFAREHWIPKILERQTRKGWLDSGAKSLVNSAKERAKLIIKVHRPEPLDESAEQRILEIQKNRSRNRQWYS
jgi:trimethylamine--corrinoid protein Co-methyltransferase